MIFINSKIFTTVISILSVWTLFSVIAIEVEKDEVKKEEVAVENKIARIKRDNALLGEYIKNFENSEFLEKEARLKFNYKKQGEEVVFVYMDLDSQKASPAEEFSKWNPFNYKKLWHWLFQIKN